MTPINTILGWAGLLFFVLFFVGLIYVDLSSRRLLREALKQGSNSADLRAGAELALNQGFRARVAWLKAKGRELGDGSEGAKATVLVYSLCWVALAILAIVWAAAMLLPAR